MTVVLTSSTPRRHRHMGRKGTISFLSSTSVVFLLSRSSIDIIAFPSPNSFQLRSPPTSVSASSRQRAIHDSIARIRAPSIWTTPTTKTSSSLQSYGKGSEIWPECNEEPIRLSSSFPGGVIPRAAMDLLEKSSVSGVDGFAAIDSSNATTTTTTIEQRQPKQPSKPPKKTSGRKRRAIRQTLSRILQSAALSQRKSTSASSSSSDAIGIQKSPVPSAMAKSPFAIASFLLLGNCVPFRCVGGVWGLTVYLLGLTSWCAAPKTSVLLTGGSGSSGGMGGTNGEIVYMPSLPSKGHVPNLIVNPLGSTLTNSRIYRTWLRIGALLGILAPIIVLTGLTLHQFSIEGRILENIRFMKWLGERCGDYFVGSGLGEAGLSVILGEMVYDKYIGVLRKLVGGHVFLLCCQAMTEALARTALLPLPIRILIPVSYNTLRLTSIHPWAFPATLTLPKSLRMLGLANLLYWYANLLFFLIPVGVVRYLRAHFFCVEAVEVTVRNGGESSIGLLS